MGSRAMTTEVNALLEKVRCGLHGAFAQVLVLLTMNRVVTHIDEVGGRRLPVSSGKDSVELRPKC